MKYRTRRQILLIGLCVLLCAPSALNAEPRGDRVLGIDVTTASDDDYDSALEIAQSAGLGEIGLFFNWNSIEKRRGKYRNPNFRIANLYYPLKGIPVNLTITPIHTNRKVVPRDLAHAAFDDPSMIRRFNRMLDWVFSQIPDLSLTSIVIGSEFDVYLGTDPKAWLHYRKFYERAARHIKLKRPGLPVAAEATFSGLTGASQALLVALNASTEIVGVSYYPLNDTLTVKDPTVVRSDFDTLLALYPNRQMNFYQVGYPSSTLLESSEDKQSQFVEELFKAWDAYPTQIHLIVFDWLHDQSPESVESLSKFYGITDDNFKEFLGSLGLRTYAGADKAAFTTLRTEAGNRGF